MKMNALWWWIDRWRKSSAYMDMTLEQQGAYRNLLDEATLRGGPLPNDERMLAKACGDAKAWRRVRAVVLARFVLTPDGWRNETLDAVLKDGERRATNQAHYRSRRDNKPDNKRDNAPITNPITNAVSPITYHQSLITDHKKEEKSRPPPPPDARSKRPIFSGQKITVFEWMLDDCVKTLGHYTDAFDLHTWFFTLDAAALAANLIVPKRDGGAWLQEQLLLEAQRRGLPLVFATTTAPQLGKLSTRLASALANIKAEAQHDS